MTRTVRAIWLAVLLVGAPTIATAAPPATNPGKEMNKEASPGTGGPGASEYAPQKAPGQQNKPSDPGKSEYAPGQTNSTTAPGNSENAPGKK